MIKYSVLHGIYSKILIIIIISFPITFISRNVWIKISHIPHKCTHLLCTHKNLKIFKYPKFFFKKESNCPRNLNQAYSHVYQLLFFPWRKNGKVLWETKRRRPETVILSVARLPERGNRYCHHLSFLSWKTKILNPLLFLMSYKNFKNEPEVLPWMPLFWPK